MTELNFAQLQKKRLFEQWIKGDHVLVHLDGRRDEVEVPVHLKSEPALTLKLSYHFQGTTEHDDDRIVTYLKFRDGYSRCVLPWTAVWGITSDAKEQRLWPNDIPKEVRKGLLKSSLKDLKDKLFSRLPSRKEQKLPESEPQVEKEHRPQLEVVLQPEASPDVKGVPLGTKSRKNPENNGNNAGHDPAVVTAPAAHAPQRTPTREGLKDVRAGEGADTATAPRARHLTRIK